MFLPLLQSPASWTWLVVRSSRDPQELAVAMQTTSAHPGHFYWRAEPSKSNAQGFLLPLGTGGHHPATKSSSISSGRFLTRSMFLVADFTRFVTASPVSLSTQDTLRKSRSNSSATRMLGPRSDTFTSVPELSRRPWRTFQIR